MTKKEAIDLKAKRKALKKLIETKILKAFNDMDLHESCWGCENIDKEVLPGGGCKIYDFPKRQWTRTEGCAARTHNKVVPIEDRKMLNPLKASKRGVKQSVSITGGRSK